MHAYAHNRKLTPVACADAFSSIELDQDLRDAIAGDGIKVVPKCMQVVVTMEGRCERVRLAVLQMHAICFAMR